MTTLTLMIPRNRVPLLGVGHYVLGAKPAARSDLLVFYRSLHCPVCMKYLSEPEWPAPEFEKRGERSVAISSEGPERAAKDGRVGQGEPRVLRLRPAVPSRPRMGSALGPRPTRVARVLQQIPRLSGQTRRNTLLRSHAIDAVCAPAVRRSARHHQLPDYKGLPRAWQIRGRGSSHGRTQSLRCRVIRSAFDPKLPEPSSHAQDLITPAASCFLFHQRAGCSADLSLKPGDHYLFCSYEFFKCPPKRVEGDSCCALSPVDEARAPCVQLFNQGETL